MRLFCKGHDREGCSAILWLAAGEEDVGSGDIALQVPPMAGQAWGGEQPCKAQLGGQGAGHQQGGGDVVRGTGLRSAAPAPWGGV